MFEEYHASKNARLFAAADNGENILFDRVFESRWNQTNDNKIGICCFSDKYKMYVGLMCKSKGWLSRNQNNAPQWV